MTLYAPKNIKTGELGPRFDSMTAAALWVIARLDVREWEIVLCT